MPKVESRDGSTIVYTKTGQGPVIILVLGALNKRGSGKKLTEQLKKNFTVISYDRRGRGDSTDTLPYSTTKEVEDLEALIDGLGGSVYLYGHSSGAVLALLAAKQLGNKIKGLAIYELPYNADPVAQKASKEYRKNMKNLLNQDKHGQAVVLFVKLFGVTDKQIAAMKRLPMWKGLTAMAPTLAYDTIKLMEQYPKLDLKKIKTKTLVMFGATSPDFMSTTARTISKMLPKAKLHGLEKQSHDVKASVLAPVLTEFFATE